MKKTRTIQDYKELGALLRLIYSLAVNAEVMAGGMFPLKKIAKLERLVDNLIQIKGDLDTQLFIDFPDIGKPGTHIFYGGLGREPLDEIDEEVVALAKIYAEELFKG